MRRACVLVSLLAAAMVPVVEGTAAASHPQPPPTIEDMDYTPIGKFGPAGQNELATGETASPSIPPTNSPLMPTAGKRYNPSGKYVAYDTDVFEVLSLPFRAANDQSNADPLGNGGDPRHGFCQQTTPDPDGLAPLTPAAGRCPNHQLEYIDYFEETMKDILGPFGVTMKRYPFQSPGSGNTKSGQAYNVAAVVPGADHPEETVLVSGHYDQTTEGPASAWDSAEGHAEVIRMAKIMADYWRTTGTRPGATIKFIPWDQEESGTLGSIDYVENNVVPGEEANVRGYFNVDPCAGAYPAFRRGVPGDRVPMSLQLVNPEDHADDPEFIARAERFNQRALTVVDDVMNNLDDKLFTTAGEPDIFVSDQEATPATPSQRGEVQTALGGLLLFTSDYANFEGIGVPFFNLSPSYFGPSANGDPNSEEGLAILHTPNDNLRTINALTDLDQTGSTVGEGWAKGMEFCAQVESWYMLQPEMAGGQTADLDVLAYYEALPNEAIRNQNVTFDASGSYEYTSPSLQLTDDLTYAWDFGDGTTGTGKTVDHAYTEVGKYLSRLTVTSKSDASQSDTMEVPITVIGSNFRAPVLQKPPPEDSDGTFPLDWDFEADREGFERFSVQQSSDLRTLLDDPAETPPSDRWTVSPADDPKVEPWQPSDSPTPKLRGNQKRSGERSYWTGVSPENFNPSPTNQNSVLTLDQAIDVPATGDTQLEYGSLFQNEGDDQGRVEVALASDDPAAELDWQPVDIVSAVSTALGGPPDTAICNPSDPSTFTNGLENRRASLDTFAGKRVRLRFVYRLGAEDRISSQPCGWYVDDVRLTSGSFQEIGSTAETSFAVNNRPAGTYGYRILGVYTDGIRTGPSNTEVVRVTSAGSQGGSGGTGGTGGGSPQGGSGSPGARRCARASGRLRGPVLDPARLGRTRASTRRRLPARRLSRRGFDYFCLADGGTLRVGHPRASYLRRVRGSTRRRVRGKAVLILTNSRRYRTSGVGRGTRAATLRRRLRTGPGIRIGGSRWFVRRGRKSTRVFRVRGGRVQELGVAGRRLTKSRRAARRLLASF